MVCSDIIIMQAVSLRTRLEPQLCNSNTKIDYHRHVKTASGNL